MKLVCLVGGKGQTKSRRRQKIKDNHGGTGGFSPPGHPGLDVISGLSRTTFPLRYNPGDATGSLAKSIDFSPTPITPASEISLTSSLTAGVRGGWGGDSLTLITHQCSSLRTISTVYPWPQPFFQVCIDPTSALLCDPELSVTSRPRCCPPGRGRTPGGGGLKQQRTRGKIDDFPTKVSSIL